MKNTSSSPAVWPFSCFAFLLRRASSLEFEENQWGKQPQDVQDLKKQHMDEDQN